MDKTKLNELKAKVFDVNVQLENLMRAKQQLIQQIMVEANKPEPKKEESK